MDEDEPADGRSESHPAGDFLRRLQEPDDRSLRFNPLGLGGRLAPERAAEFQAAAIGRAMLHEDVHEGVRDLFERVRLLHIYGVLEYEFFTAALDQVCFVLEAALRLRFLEYYAADGVTLARGEEVRTRPLASFEKAKDLAERGWLLRASDGTDHELPRSMSALLAWSRREGLLPGRRTRRVDRTLVRFRHWAAHPMNYRLQMPPDAASHINDVAEFINRLWGHDTPGGSVFPGPVTRRLRVASLSYSRDQSLTYPNLDNLSAPAGVDDPFEFALFRAAEREDLVGLGWGGDTGLRFAFTEGFETTNYPCERLYQGPLAGLRELLASADIDPTPDQPLYLDREFVIREAAGGTLDAPRSREQFDALGSAREHGRWHVVVADSPWDARSHVQHHNDIRLHADGTCPACFVLLRDVLDHPQSPEGAESSDGGQSISEER